MQSHVAAFRVRQGDVRKRRSAACEAGSKPRHFGQLIIRKVNKRGLESHRPRRARLHGSAHACGLDVGELSCLLTG